MSDDRKYDDILDLPRPRSRTRPPMPRADRAAQFSPFAALSGHGEAVREAGRLTGKRLALDEDAQAELAARLTLLSGCLAARPQVAITYFVPDARKAGGAYVTERGPVRRIDADARAVVMQSGVAIPFADIAALEGALFDSAYE